MSSRGAKVKLMAGLAVAAAATLAVPAAQAAFPGTNGKIAYVCVKGSFTATSDPREICTIKPGGTEKRLTNNSVGDFNPSFSADGTEIAFDRSKSATCPASACSDIYRMSATGGNVKRLTKTSSASESDPAWSPSGKKLAYAKGSGGNPPKIVLMRASDGTVLKALGTGFEPNWSPDGAKIAFSKEDHLWCTLDQQFCVAGYGIYTMSASDGSGKTMLTSTTEYADGTACSVDQGCPETNGNPNYAPSGTLIAWDIFDSDAQTGSIWRMTAGGGSKTGLIPFGSVGTGCPQHPAYSPDGLQIAFADGYYCNTGGQNPQIWVKTLASGSPVSVANGFQPDWVPAP
jgi:Tol biopolymer transport system component